MNSSEKNQLRSELSKIGKNSLFLIENIEKESGKDELWQKSVEINKIAHSIYQMLDDRHLPNSDAIKEEKGWEDYYNNPYLN